MGNISANDLAQVSSDLRQVAKKYSDSERELGQQILNLDGHVMNLVFDGGTQWKGQASDAFIGAWNQRRTRIQQASSLMNQSASILTQMAQKIDDHLSTIRSDQSLLQGPNHRTLGPDDQSSIMDELSQAENAIITGLSMLNSQLEALAEEVGDCPEEKEGDPFPYGKDFGNNGINKSDSNAGGKENPGASGNDEGTPETPGQLPTTAMGLQQTKAEAYYTLETLKQELDQHPELKGQYAHEYDKLLADYKEASDILSNPQSDPELATLAHESILDITGRAGQITSEIRERFPQIEVPSVPAYVTENRVPLDRETFLNDANRFERTNIVEPKGSVVYRDKETGWYYHRDTFHKGAGAEIEVYDSRGKHIGEVTPDGQYKGPAVPGRRISIP